MRRFLRSRQFYTILLIMFRPRGEIIRVPASKDPIATSKSVYKCDICDDGGWTSETEAAIHSKAFHKNEITILARGSTNAKPLCLVCLKKQPDPQTLLMHYKEIHLLSSLTARRVEREIFICDICDRIFFNKPLLEMHIFHRHYKNATKRGFLCRICLKQLSQKFIYSHFCNAHQIQSVSCCPICLKKCDNISSLQEHVAATHRKHLLCNICGFETTREDLYNNHLDSYMSKPKIIKEPEGSIFYNKYFLKPRSKAMWKFPIPSAAFGLELYNRIHICIICREICASKKEAMKHIWRDHNCVQVKQRKNVHKCSCGEEFLHAVLLKQHIFKLKGSGHSVVIVSM